MKKTTLLSLGLMCCMSIYAQRETFLINDNWDFRFSHQVERTGTLKVTLPHTWNAQDALSGKLDYKRGIGNYEKELFIPQKWNGKRVFLRFKGANTVADVFINGKFIGNHKGGYSAFLFEITDCLTYGKPNKVWVRVSNAERLDVMPLVGDFNFYGGIYRDVELLVTEQACISPLDYASPGVYLIQNHVRKDVAEISAKIRLSNKDTDNTYKAVVRVMDGNREVLTEEQEVRMAANTEIVATIPFTIKNPHLWNGREDPFLYRVEISLWKGNERLDTVTEQLGVRSFHVEPDKGFYLNGKPLKLRGVCRHQDRAEIGNALRMEHHEEDAQIMLEMGANAVRLAHYQQAEEFYDLMDRYGLVTWAEIPFVGPGGYLDKGFVDSPEFRSNGKEQLKELIRQNYNHPSICFWGLFNEVKEAGDNPVDYIKELNVLAHQEDATRLTTSASNQEGQLNFISDCIAWNRYDGWYGGQTENLAHFLDQTHEEHPELCIGISEYGAGGSIYHQQDTLKQPVPVSMWHPENWQTEFHRKNWQIIQERPFVWGSFIWNLFDFGAAHRHEGDRIGINDKGLVTFDRKNRKDAFYFYKVNWNPEPMVYLAEKRNKCRTRVVQDFMAFSNVGKLDLYLDGKKVGTSGPDVCNVVQWKGIQMGYGTHYIEVKSADKKYSDCVTIEILPTLTKVHGNEK